MYKYVNNILKGQVVATISTYKIYIHFDCFSIEIQHFVQMYKLIILVESQRIRNAFV